MKHIYLYHLIQNGRVRYVGLTTNITKRKYRHKREKPPHTFEIIETFSDKEQAGIAEQYHIAGHKTFWGKNGWNKSIGGEKLLSGENHPRWIDGLSLLDKKAYYKRHHQRNRKRISIRKKKHNQKPEIIAKKKEYDKEYYAQPEVKARKQTPEYKAIKKEYSRKYQQRPEVKERERERSKKRYQMKKHPIFDLFSGAFI
jgi:hypothetical protein